MKKCTWFLVFTLSTSLVVAAPLTNGSFELGTDPGPSFLSLSAGNSDITGWSIDGTVDYISGYWNASDGGRSIDMNGNSAGAVYQTFATSAGQTYNVSFDLAGNPDLGPSLKRLRATVDGYSGDYAFDITGVTRPNLGWVTYQFSFVADGSSTLRFESLDAGFCGPTLDNVVVEAAPVPEPASMAVLAIGLGAIARRRRRA